MALVTTGGTIIKVNKAFAELVGGAIEDLLDRPFESLLAADAVVAHNRELTKLFYGAVPATRIEHNLLHRDGRDVWAMWSASLMPGDIDEEPHYIFQFQDITEKREAERRIAHDALHDALTGLPNRMLFVDRVQIAFRRAKRGFGVDFAVCYLDLDRFNLVNETFGHEAGDKLLLEFAERIRTALGTSDTVARLGGDEFALLLEDISGEDAVADILERIRGEIARPFEVDSRSIYFTASFGVAPWAADYDSPDEMLRDADTALDRAKRHGRNRYEFFSVEMRESTIQHLQNETDLREAVYSNQFRAFYQPIVNIESGTLAGFEALIRWDHPSRGLVSPSGFIATAEETGLIFPIGEWMLRESCCQLSDWRHRNSDALDIWVSVNVSAKQFMAVDLVALVKDVLAKSGLPAELLKLELTETAMAENIDHVVEVMERLKAIGVRLSIDDFGTGYSSLSNLHRLPLDSLKIDRAFVSQLTKGGGDEIVRTIIELGRTLDLELIAEGVEDPGQLESLRLLGCQMGQGYIYSRPLEAAAAEAYIADRQTGSKIQIPPVAAPNKKTESSRSGRRLST
jgi:diguanylate cyclase (GGDEF)-like protein/PAS domain S-box-containing protein